jgi:cytochrome o ubiquinol oxidase operon protein cyoD
MNTKNYYQEINAWPRHTHSLLRAYIAGFLLSLVLTVVAYFITLHTVFGSAALIISLLLLACTQFGVQVVCFLHLSTDRHSRDRTIVLVVACLIVLILIVGSLWIMTHLNDRMMVDPVALQEYMQSQGGI